MILDSEPRLRTGGAGRAVCPRRVVDVCPSRLEERMTETGDAARPARRPRHKTVISLPRGRRLLPHG